MERIGDSTHRKETRGPSRLEDQGIYCTVTVHLGMEKRTRFHFADSKETFPYTVGKEKDCMEGDSSLIFRRADFTLQMGVEGRRKFILNISRNDVGRNIILQTGKGFWDGKFT